MKKYSVRLGGNIMGRKVAVLLGGKSEEREISLKTGEAVYQALINLGYSAKKIDAAGPVINQLKEYKPDVVFIALHGKYGEDGTIQGVIETLGFLYTGCGILASALAMNKIYTKKILAYDGIPTADFMTVTSEDISQDRISDLLVQIREKIGYPLVVKAPTLGSSIGIYFISKEDELLEGIKNAFTYDPVILIEKFIVGTEVTISVLGNEQPFALPSLEIVSKTGRYDYEAKYTKGLSEFIIPARIPKDTDRIIGQLAVKTYQTIGCRGFARVDFIIGENHQPFVLEINTIPGMTETSLMPAAARAFGIEFPQLVEKFVNLALDLE
jgi:D-alanine-D-alanine ligase